MSYGVTSYYLADGLGSTTQLTDSAGAITDSYSYDVFGAPRSTTGTTANDFRYTGQQRDGNANRGSPGTTKGVITKRIPSADPTSDIQPPASPRLPRIVASLIAHRRSAG